MSPRWNFSASTAAARADSDVGSRNPPPDRLVAAGRPKTAVPTMTKNARPRMTRRGAAMAIWPVPIASDRPFRWLVVGGWWLSRRVWPPRSVRAAVGALTPTAGRQSLLRRAKSVAAFGVGQIVTPQPVSGVAHERCDHWGRMSRGSESRPIRMRDDGFDHGDTRAAVRRRTDWGGVSFDDTAGSFAFDDAHHDGARLRGW